MKQIFRYILFVLAGAFILASCHDYKDDNMVEDTVYLRSSDDGLVQEVSVYDQVVRFGVIKSGKGRSACTVQLGIDSGDKLFDYNEEHETGFVSLARKWYNADELEDKQVTFSPEDARVKVDVKWDPFDMVGLMLTETDDFVIPVYIKSSSITVNEKKSLLLIRPVLSTLSVRAADNAMTCKEESTFTAKVGVKLDHAIPGHDVRVNLSFSPKAMTVNGISYEAAPSGSINLVSSEVIIKAGDFESDVEVDLDMTGVPGSVKYVSGVIRIDSAAVVIEDGEDINFIPVVQDEMAVRVTKTAK